MTVPEIAPEPRSSPSVLAMALPLVVSFWMRAAFSLVDTVYAATIGDEAVAAIGLTAPFEFLLIALWVGLSTGLTSCLSRAMGAREGRKIAQYLRVSWNFVLMIVPLFLLGGIGIWFWAPHMGLSPAVQRAFQIYGTVLVSGSAITAFWSVLPDSLIKAHQDTRSTMWAGITSNLINVTLNTIFVFVFHWGVFGIALSTVIGRIGGLVYAQARARRHERERLRTVPDASDAEDPRPYRAILGLAVPSALTFVLMSGETAVVNYLLAGLPHATPSIAAYSIYYRVLLFMLNPIIAVSVALLPYAAKRVGEGDGAGLRLGLRQAGIATAAYSLLVALPVLVWSAPLIARGLAESPLTVEYAAFALRIVPVALLASAPFLLCRPVFEGMQRGRPGLYMAVLRYAFLSLPLAYGGIAIATGLDQPGVYGLIIGLLVAAGFSSAVFAGWLYSVLRREVPDASGAAGGPRSMTAN